MRRLKNVTITLEDDVARWARIEAARENTSVSRFVGDLLADRMHQDREYEAAMDHYLSVRPRAISKGRQYPLREALHDRSSFR